MTTHRWLLVGLGLISAVALVVLVRARADALVRDPADTTIPLLNATLVAVQQIAGPDETGLFPGATTVLVTARLEDGDEIVVFETTDETGDTYRAGQAVKLARIDQEGFDSVYYVSDFRRDRPLLLLACLFAFAVLAFGRWHGLRALSGLVLTVLVVVLVVIPSIVGGASPVPVALAASVLVMTVTLYLTHGFEPTVTAAVVGTGLALALTGALASLFVSLANITGFASEEARMATLQVDGLSLRGLLLAGIVIGGLGVLDDVTIAQASTVAALRRAAPNASTAHVIAQALKVGRDHVGAAVNTLFLAYAGASLPLLLLFSTSPDGWPTIMTSEVVATELIRTLVGSVGLIAAVPVTTALAALLEPPPVDAQNPAPLLPEDGDDDWEQRLRSSYGM